MIKIFNKAVGILYLFSLPIMFSQCTSETDNQSQEINTDNINVTLTQFLFSVYVSNNGGYYSN